MNVPGPTPAQRARFAASLDALAPAGPLVVGVSGGPDSLALLLLSASARPGGTIAATVDHGLRDEARDEARHVHGICRRFGIHHRVLEVEVEDDGGGIQASARTARYAALGRYAERKGAPALATAHHVDDQAETVLMRMARGAGVGGLAGVRDRRPLTAAVTLVRPLLGWRRAELAAIVAAARLDAVDDPSNRDMRFDRTRARMMLAEGWPEADRLAAVARHMADAEEALAWSADRAFAERFRMAGGDATLEVEGLPREIVRRLATAAVRALAPGAEPRGDEVARLIDRVAAGHASTLAGIRIAPGTPWRLSRAADRRSD